MNLDRFLLCVACWLIATSCFAAIAQAAERVSSAGAGALPVPTPAQFLWHEQERIMFVCLDPATWQGREYDDHSTPLSEMKLAKLDTDQWCEAALTWGARQILFVAKHTGGFCWWRTDTTDYCVKGIAWRNGEGDVLEELARSCGKYGLNMGIYVYPGDTSWGAGIGSGGKTSDPGDQQAYNEVFRTQLRETIDLAARYTRVTEVWFDGSCVIEVGDILREHAPDAVVFQGPHASIRWVGNERGRLDGGRSWNTLAAADRATGLATAQHSSPDGDAWAPLEVNTTLYDHYWFWSPKKQASRKRLDELMRVYYESVGQGAVMLLNSTPNTDGLIPQADMELYRALGGEIERRFGRPLAQTRGIGTDLELVLGQPTLVNHMVLMEEYQHGERVRAFVVEGHQDGQWRELATGTHVGRKRIVTFPDTVVDKVRVRVSAAVMPPIFRQFQVFFVPSYQRSSGHPTRHEQVRCGEWTRADLADGSVDLTIDLTPYIKEAGQWRVEFRPSAPDYTVQIGKMTLFQAGQPSAPGAIQQVAGQGNVLNVNRTAVVTEKSDIKLHVALKAAPCDGIVLIHEVE